MCRSKRGCRKIGRSLNSYLSRPSSSPASEVCVSGRYREAWVGRVLSVCASLVSGSASAFVCALSYSKPLNEHAGNKASECECRRRKDGGSGGKRAGCRRPVPVARAEYHGERLVGGGR